MESRRDETREAFLAAGVRLYGTMSDRLLRGFTAGAVASEAGFRRQTFYRYWDTQADYVRDLVEHVLRGRGPVSDGMAVLPTRRGGRRPWDALVRDIARYDYGRTAGDPQTTMRMGLVSMRALEDDELRGQAQDLYDQLLDRMAASLERALAERGRAPHPPLSCRDLARVQRALLIGLVHLELLADDEPTGSDLYEEVFVLLLDRFTEAREDDFPSSGAS